MPNSTPASQEDVRNINSRIDSVVIRLEKIEKDRDLLIRMDERQAQILKEITLWRETFLTKVEFEPIKKIVYGVVGISLTALMGAILSIILRSQ